MRALARKLLHFLAQLEIHPRRTLAALLRLPGYWREYRAFARRSDWPMTVYPCLFDRGTGSAHLGEYFWQDLHVARRIIEAAPARHIDIGSRVDGFIAHLACVRPVEVRDIRPLHHAIPNVRFTQWDLMAPAAAPAMADCVSCLHTLEHIGLGRYGDALDPEGWKTGLASLAGLLRPGGTLWLSVPTGRRRVEFNAHRVFDPRDIVAQAASCGLVLAELAEVRDDGVHGVADAVGRLPQLAAEDGLLAIYRFERVAGAA